MLTTLLLATLLGDEAIRLIVQGDDMGAAHAIHEGTIRAYREVVMRTTNIIVPGPGPGCPRPRGC